MSQERHSSNEAWGSIGLIVARVAWKRNGYNDYAGFVEVGQSDAHTPREVTV